jgi:hypothetical protein
MSRAAQHCAIVATFAGVILAGCGSSQAPVQHTAIRASATAEPAMVMITLTDRGYRASDIDVALRQPVMFMIVNRGAHPYELRAAVPVSSLQVDDPAATGAQAAAYRPGTLDVTTPAGHEIDVTFVPSQPGRFDLSVGDLPAGAVVVG